MTKQSRLVKIDQHQVPNRYRSRHGHPLYRLIEFFTGHNKGKTYPYRSVKRGGKPDERRPI